MHFISVSNVQYFSEKQGGVCVRAGVNKQVER